MEAIMAPCWYVQNILILKCGCSNLAMVDDTGLPAYNDIHPQVKKHTEYTDQKLSGLIFPCSCCCCCWSSGCRVGDFAWALHKPKVDPAPWPRQSVSSGDETYDKESARVEFESGKVKVKVVKCLVLKKANELILMHIYDKQNRKKNQ